MKKYPFIAFEGIDGSGKSTQARMLADYLESSGIPLYFTFEPTKGNIGKLLRDILTGKTKADERVIAGLFAADRLDHILNEEEGMLMQQNMGKAIVCDRYYFSSYAYNGLHTQMDWVIAANAMSAETLRPDVHIFIDVPPEICMQRVKANREQIDLYETEENLTRVRNKFFEAFEKLKGKENIIVIDGNRPVDQVSKDIIEIVFPLF